MNMIYCTLARQIRRRFKWRKVGGWVIAFSPPCASPQWGKCRQHSQDRAFTSQLRKLVQSTCSPMALPSFCPSTPLSLASAPHPQHGKALLVAPIRAPKFQKKLPERHHYLAAIVLLPFPATRPACAWVGYTGTQTPAENTLRHLAIFSSGLCCCSSCLASTPAQNTAWSKGLSLACTDTRNIFGIEVAESSETQEWKKLMGSRLKKGLTTQELVLPQ